MLKFMDFAVYCLEEYRNEKNMSGKDAFKLFFEKKVFDYIENNFDYLHLFGGDVICGELDSYLQNAPA